MNGDLPILSIPPRLFRRWSQKLRFIFQNKLQSSSASILDIQDAIRKILMFEITGNPTFDSIIGLDFITIIRELHFIQQPRDCYQFSVFEYGITIHLLNRNRNGVITTNHPKTNQAGSFGTVRIIRKKKLLRRTCRFTQRYPLFAFVNSGFPFHVTRNSDGDWSPDNIDPEFRRAKIGLNIGSQTELLDKDLPHNSVRRNDVQSRFPAIGIVDCLDCKRRPPIVIAIRRPNVYPGGRSLISFNLPMPGSGEKRNFLDSTFCRTFEQIIVIEECHDFFFGRFIIRASNSQETCPKQNMYCVNSA